MHDSNQRIAEAARIIETESGRDAAIHQYRLRWGLTDVQAEQLYGEAQGLRKARRRRKTIWGIAGAVAIAVVAEAFGLLLGVLDGVYAIGLPILAFLVLLISVVFIVRANRQAGQTANNKKPIWQVYALMGVVVLMGVVSVGGFIWQTANAVPPPEETDIQWLHDEVEIVSSSSARFTGEIINNNTNWAVVRPRLKLTFYDGQKNLITDQEFELTDVPVEPGESYGYSQLVELSPDYARYDSNLVWDWRKSEQ